VSDLVLDSIVKRFGSVVAVDRFSLEVGKGEFLSFLGPSGCGKTTVLRLIAGYEALDGGDILIRGRSTRGVPPHRRNVGMVFQNYALFPHLTVFDNVGFGLVERRMARDVIRAKVRAALELVHLGHLEDRYPSQLSGGQQQRVALARALVIEPELLLLDEPLSNLDAQLREEMRVEIKELQAKLGITTVFVTHDQVEALTLSSRIVVMRQGRAAQLGTPEQVYAAPRSRFAFEFLGGTNILEGRIVEQRGDELAFETGSGLRILGRRRPEQAADLRLLGVRPEAIRVVADGAADAPNTAAGQVRSVLYRGWTREIVVQLRSGEVIKAVEVLPGMAVAPLAPGASVALSWSAESCHLLEGD